MGDFKSRLITRKTGYWTDCIPAAVFLSLMLMLAGLVFNAVLDHVLGVRTWLQGLGSDTAVQFAQFYLDFFGIWIAFFLFTESSKANRPMLSCLLGDIHLTFNAFQPGVLLLL